MRNLNVYKGVLCAVFICLALSACDHMPFGKKDVNTKESVHQPSKSKSKGKPSVTTNSSTSSGKTNAVGKESTSSAAPTPLSTAANQFKPRKDFVIKKTNLNVAIMAPISVDKSDGRGMQDAAYLALEDLNVKKVNLVSIDTGSDEQSMKKAIAKLKSQEIDVIIGPLNRERAELVYQEYAKDRNVLIMALGGQDEISQYPGLYFLDFVPKQQVDRLMQYAKSQGYTDIYALLPNTHYGQGIYKDLYDNKTRVNLLGVRTYDVDGNDKDASFNQAVLEVKNVVADLYKQQAAKRSEDKFMNVALLIPEGGPRLDYVAENVKLVGGQNLLQLKKLGTSLWMNYPTKSLPDLEGAWITDSPQNMKIAFEQRFKSRFGYVPPRNASIAYDAVALITGVSTQSDADIQLNSGSLMNSNGFEGATGVFKFTEDGFTSRLFSIYEVRAGRFVEIDKAPENFSD